ncbi:MAG: TrkA family potassium uptake protein [Anaerolineae bacterium]|nr:TrkA family potassium uptake protein [Anaerolineae bacterium]MCX8067091.1 TrkA family potassium uptake protein [Anaerolineae bacterium]MDW7992067.1 TrkA family potassium uptake protein [Anaerolineae bacterium]
MRVLIVGGGKVGSHLALLLLADGYEVCVVENRPTVLARLYRELPTEVVMDGDGTRLSVLEQAGIRSSDVLVAVTGDDETNLAVAMMGRFIFHVPRIIARVNNPRNAWLFTPEAGVDVALNQSDLLAKLIAEEMSLGDMMTLVRLRRGELAIVTEKLEPGAPAESQRIADLPIPSDCLVMAVVRGEEIQVPRGDTVLQAGDEVLALVRREAGKALNALLRAPGR